MAGKPPFALTRCTEADMEELLQVQYECFSPEMRVIMMGCHSPADLPKLEEKYTNYMLQNPSDVWVKVTDLETGKIIAGGNWRIYANYEAAKHDNNDAIEWLEGELLEKTKAVINLMHKSRIEALQGPSVFLHVCFTDAKYRRRGAGGMILRWGCDIADQLFVPGWVDASADGTMLYKRFGFYECGKIAQIDGINMKRDVRNVPVLGGKYKPGN